MFIYIEQVHYGRKLQKSLEWLENLDFTVGASFKIITNLK